MIAFNIPMSSSKRGPGGARLQLLSGRENFQSGKEVGVASVLSTSPRKA